MKLYPMVISVALAGSLSALPVMAADVPDQPHISTSGHASVEVKPDMATLKIVVEQTARQAAEAKKRVDDRVAQYFDYLQQQGVVKKDIDAANISTQPQYDYSKQGKPQLTGYQALRQVTVTVRQIDKLNTLLDGALKAGLNEIRSVSPGVSQPQRYQQQARDEAIKDAISQASALAKGFNTRLGPVWSIQYHTEDTSARPVMRMYSLAKANADTTPQQTYEQQSISFDDNVNVVFELFPPSKPAVTPVAEPENQP